MKRSFITHNDSSDININFTQLQGTIQASQRQLEAAFGAPATPANGDNVTTTWNILFADDVVATLYDWGKRNVDPAETIVWNIGGRAPHGREAVELVHARFREANGLGARSAA